MSGERLLQKNSRENALEENLSQRIAGRASVHSASARSEKPRGLIATSGFLSTTLGRFFRFYLELGADRLDRALRVRDSSVGGRRGIDKSRERVHRLLNLFFLRRTKQRKTHIVERVE